MKFTLPLMSVGARFPLVLFPNGKRARGLALDAQVAWIDLFEETKGMGVVFIRGQSMLKKVAQLVDAFEADIKK